MRSEPIIVEHKGQTQNLRCPVSVVLPCFDCWHFDRTKKIITNYEGELVEIMRGCRNYADCHHGGRKSLWAQR